MRTIVEGIAATFEMSATLRYERRYPATVNSEAETGHALAAATAVVGRAKVDTDPMPSMGSEDFAFMLQAKPGCYVWIGTGKGPDTPNLHNPRYDFNDDALAIGASYWVTLAEQQLPAQRSARPRSRSMPAPPGSRDLPRIVLGVLFILLIGGGEPLHPEAVPAGDHLGDDDRASRPGRC